MKNVDNPLVGIRRKPIKIEGSVELITLGDRDRKRMLKKLFMAAKIEAPYNAIFGRLLNELCTILSVQYLMMKFKADKRHKLY